MPKFLSSWSTPRVALHGVGWSDPEWNHFIAAPGSIKDTEGEQNNTVVSLRIEISQNTHAGGGEREIK